MTAPDPRFPAPEEGEPTWARSFRLAGGQEVKVQLFPSLIKSELRDQVSLKSSIRKAALRASQKHIARLAKLGVDRLGDQQLEDLRWSLFICHVDAVLAGRHLELRDKEDALEALVDDPAFHTSSP